MRIITRNKIAYPALYDGNLLRSFVATRAQKMTTGANISNKVTVKEPASGPNINLPPQKNFCTEIEAYIIE